MAFFGRSYFSDMVYGKEDWDYQSFDVDSGFKEAEERTGKALNASDPNLKPFRARGGKLIVYHGWNDAAIPAGSSVNYFESVRATMGQPTMDSFLRIYMLPGVQHCSGGPGPDSIGLDWSTEDPQHSVRVALERWVESGIAPSTMFATKYAGTANRAGMSRPICAYPQEAKYKGTGDPNDAANFDCLIPKR
jgi:Tannase and feruloyl esterase